MMDSIAPALSIVPGGAPSSTPAGVSSQAPGTPGFDAVLRGSLAANGPAPRKQGSFAETNAAGAMIMAAAGLPLPVPTMTFAGTMPAPLAGGQSSPDAKMQNAPVSAGTAWSPVTVPSALSAGKASATSPSSMRATNQSAVGSAIAAGADAAPVTTAPLMPPDARALPASRGDASELVAETTPGAPPIWTTPSPTSTEYYPLRQLPEPTTEALPQPPVVRVPGGLPGGLPPAPITPTPVVVRLPGGLVGTPTPAPVVNPEDVPAPVARPNGEAGQMPVAPTTFAGGEDLFISLVREMGGQAARAAWNEMVAPPARPVLQTPEAARAVADSTAPLGRLINTPLTTDTGEANAEPVVDGADTATPPTTPTEDGNQAAETITDTTAPRASGIDAELRRLLDRTFRLPEREGEGNAVGSATRVRSRDDEVTAVGDEAMPVFSAVTKDDRTRARDQQRIAPVPSSGATQPPLVVTLPPAESAIASPTSIGNGEPVQRPAPSSSLTAAEVTRAVAIGRMTTGPASVRTVDQVADALAIQVRDGRPEATITLRPVALGEIKVQISSGEDGLVIRMSAENDTVGELLRTNMGQLRDALAGQQVAVSELHVLHNPPAAAPASSDTTTWNERPWARQGQDDDGEDSTRQQPDESTEDE
ncbi:MAG: flagellar hook-length control protein FliK [Chloroflexi bacterium]|nr:flagellar hook-length control protein FliK [Chloroflexota bacterium]